MRIVIVGCCLAGCGRFGFTDSRSDILDASSDGTARSEVDAGPCAIAVTVADSLTFSGQTFVYTGFNNATGALSGVSVTAYEAGTANALASTVSNANGDYMLTIPTGGSARSVTLAYMPSGYWTTAITSDRPLDHDVAGPNMTKWHYGDGPVWADGQMGSVYGSAGQTHDATKGTLNIAVRDCADESIAGVSLDIQPPPPVFAYTNESGLPNTTATATIEPYTSAIGFNVEPVPTRIRASANGRTFADFTVDVQPGSYVTYPVIHPLD